MLRSLPSRTRVLAVLTLVTTFIFFRTLWRYTTCSNGQCAPVNRLVKPVSREDLQDLQNDITQLKSELEHLTGAPPKELTEEELAWESRRTKCGEGVVRNIDYHHVPPIPPNLISRASHMRNSGHQPQNNSGTPKPKNGKTISKI
jgi:hypothetical protein